MSDWRTEGEIYLLQKEKRKKMQQLQTNRIPSDSIDTKGENYQINRM